MRILNREPKVVAEAAPKAAPVFFSTPTTVAKVPPLMNKTQLKKAFENGAQIEYFSKKQNKWLNTSKPGWKVDVSYRLKPPAEPVLVAAIPKKKVAKVSTMSLTTGPWIVIQIDGEGVLKPATTPHKHESYQKAAAESLRLAQLHKGVLFAVFEAKQQTSVNLVEE